MRIISICALILFSSAGARAEDKDAKPTAEKPNFQYRTVTTPEGLVFRVPEDMPIETRDGILAPIPFDEYVYGKFSQIHRRLDALDAKLANIEAMLTRLLEAKHLQKKSPEKEKPNSNPLAA